MQMQLREWAKGRECMLQNSWFQMIIIIMVIIIHIRDGKRKKIICIILYIWETIGPESK